jgi:hypothetical protein
MIRGRWVREAITAILDSHSLHLQSGLEWEADKLQDVSREDPVAFLSAHPLDDRPGEGRTICCRCSSPYHCEFTAKRREGAVTYLVHHEQGVRGGVSHDRSEVAHLHSEGRLPLGGNIEA